MSVQGNINQGIGMVAGAIGLEKHIEEQKKANELSVAKAKETAIKDYVENSKEAIDLHNEEKAIKEDLKTLKSDENISKAKEILAKHEEGTNFKANELIRDSEGNVYTPNEYLESAKAAKKRLNDQKQALKYQKYQLAERMNQQDSQWALYGIDKHKDLGMLNSPKDQKIIHKMKEDYNAKKEVKVNGK